MRKHTNPFFKVIAFLLILITNTSLNTQTPKPKSEPSLTETIQYLRTYYMYFASPAGLSELCNYDSLNYSIKKISWTNIRNCSYSETIVINPSLIKGISIRYTPYEKHSDGWDTPAQWAVIISTPDSKNCIVIDGKRDRVNVDRFVKALSRLAVLAGAKMVDEDLFGK